MKKLKGSFDFSTEILNMVGVECISYVNLETLALETYDPYEKVENNNLLRVPYVEELFEENEVLSAYILNRDIIIPNSIHARKYLRETGWIDDFYVFLENVRREKIIEWFEENDIKIIFNA